MINVIINGALGNMGREAVKAVTNDPDLKLVASCDKDDDLVKAIQDNQADVVVDLTHPSTVKKNISLILNQGAHAVVGTTGLSEQDLEEGNTLAQEKGKALIVCPNFAIGAILMMTLAAKAAPYFTRAEIIETHHDKKADAPSGTAIKSAELLNEANPKLNQEKIDEKELIKGSRGGAKNNIPIHSVRLPGTVANQDIVFGGLGQTLTFKHHTISREAFMPGIMIAIKKAGEHTGLVYGLEKLLF